MVKIVFHKVPQTVTKCWYCGQELHCDPDAEWEHLYCTYCAKCRMHYHVKSPPKPETPKQTPTEYRRWRRGGLDEWDRIEMECE